MHFEADIPKMAAILGIDALREPQFLWIAEEALKAKLDEHEWGEFNTANGQVLYYNMKLKACNDS